MEHLEAIIFWLMIYQMEQFVNIHYSMYITVLITSHQNPVLIVLLPWIMVGLSSQVCTFPLLKIFTDQSTTSTGIIPTSTSFKSSKISSDISSTVKMLTSITSTEKLSSTVLYNSNSVYSFNLLTSPYVSNTLHAKSTQTNHTTLLVMNATNNAHSTTNSAIISSSLLYSSDSNTGI